MGIAVIHIKKSNGKHLIHSLYLDISFHICTIINTFTYAGPKNLYSANSLLSLVGWFVVLLSETIIFNTRQHLVYCVSLPAQNYKTTTINPSGNSTHACYFLLNFVPREYVLAIKEGLGYPCYFLLNFVEWKTIDAQPSPLG